MTPVGDYLKKLLYQYDCLVVPEFGAFLTHYLPASFQEATGQYLPPRKRLAFNEALRLDDGILINYVMLHESMTRDEALRAINGFVTAMKQQIRAGGSYTIDGVGLLTTNEEHKLQFHPELRHNFEAESYGFQPIQAQYCESAEVMPVSVLPLVSNTLPVLVDAGTDEGQLMPLPVRRPVWQWVAAALLVGTLGVYSYFSVLQPGDLLQSSLSPASLLRMPAFMTAFTPIPAKAPEPKPAVLPVTIPTTPVSAPVAAASKPVVVPKSEAVIEKAAPVAAAAVVKPVRLAAARKETLAAPKRTLAKPFLIVAGSFSSRQNALGLRRQLRKAGYDDAYLMAPKRAHELIKVAAFGATTLAEADSVMVKVRELTGVPAWLMRTR